jgi:bifunctional oligoribonuclease and PAP phosphatase NrnA
VEVVNRDPAPAPLMAFPGVSSIRIADRPRELRRGADHGVQRPGPHRRRGLDRYFVINVDHHPGNVAYGAINWFDGDAAACAEMVFDIIEALGVPLTPEIATHIYVGILTDTGSFHYSNISARTFDICSRLVRPASNR